LTEENKRLQKELQELRAIKVAAPHVIAHDFYMPLPAATLTMCPSCERVATVDNRSVTTFAKKPGYSHFAPSPAACWDAPVRERERVVTTDNRSVTIFAKKLGYSLFAPSPVSCWDALHTYSLNTDNAQRWKCWLQSPGRPSKLVTLMIKDVILREDVEEVCVWWKILQCYNFLIEGSSGIHLCIQMESFLRHYDHYAEKNFWFGKFCNATIFSSKAALVFICIHRWSDFPEMKMQRRTSDVANSAKLQFSDWRPGLKIICACPNSLMFQRWWQFQCAKFCNASIFSLKVALVIHLHT
jgi:hypothetical protein